MPFNPDHDDLKYKMSFNPDQDDLTEWFFVCFIEELTMYSAEKDEDAKEAIERLDKVCTYTDKFIDWCLENMDLACDYKITKRFAQAILNTLNIKHLMQQMFDWKGMHTCVDCKRVQTYCECE